MSIVPPNIDWEKLQFLLAVERMKEKESDVNQKELEGQDENKVHNSQFIRHDEDFDLAAENGQLKEMEASLRNGERIAKERIEKLKDRLSKEKRFSAAYVAIVVIVGIIGGYWMFQARSLAKDLDKAELKTVSEKSGQVAKDIIPAIHTEDGYISTQELLHQLNDVTRPLHDQIEKLEKEKAELQRQADELKAKLTTPKPEVAEEVSVKQNLPPTETDLTKKVGGRINKEQKEEEKVSNATIAVFLVIGFICYVICAIFVPHSD